MGLHRQLPDRLRGLHPKYRTPWIGILVFGGVACVAIIPGKADFLGNLYAFGAMLSFTIAHAAVIGLRLKHPDVERPYRGPGSLRVFGRSFPLFAVVGGAGTFLAFITVTFLHIEVAIAGVGWLLLGLLLGSHPYHTYLTWGWGVNLFTNPWIPASLTGR
jgi:APA family basic amino acid/polyamine antiporter